MKHIISILILICLLSVPVSAMEYSAPEPPAEVMPMMPQDTESFGDGVAYIIKQGLKAASPSLRDATSVCISLCAIAMLTGLVEKYLQSSTGVTGLVGAVSAGCLLLSASGTLIRQSIEKIRQMQEYGKLLLPTLTAVHAAQGAPVSAAALHSGTIAFLTFLVMLITKVIVPLIYGYLCLSIVSSAIDQDILIKLKTSIKGVLTWSMRTVLYVFTGYMTITSVVSGSADASTLKATRLTISGMIPVVGRILADASESVLVGAGILKSSIGVYGMIAILGIGMTPFLAAGLNYLLMKLTTILCSVWGTKKYTGLISDAATAMGYVLSMTASVLIMLFVSIICFLKGIHI